MYGTEQFNADFRADSISADNAWNIDVFQQLVDAARDSTRVSGLTHQHYRYPARFSPRFVRAAIEQFTQPGDLVFDPFMGGGTTLVEAIASGRNALGTDISSLATFVSTVKTRICSDQDLDVLLRWAETATQNINIHRPSYTVLSDQYADMGYFKHMSTPRTWRLRKALEQLLATTANLPSAKTQSFARCVALRTGQWALDGRRHLPTIDDFREAVSTHAVQMINGARELQKAVKSNAEIAPKAVCLNRTVVGIENDNRFLKQKPRLVLTSPPYPGVHVLYHRWQIAGGRETAAPFWIANKLDGSGASYYTLGARKSKNDRAYFDGLQAALASISQICDEHTTVIQVVAFSDPARQLPRYLEVAADAGLSELAVPIEPQGDGRLWRTIPNRKWHAGQLGDIPASKEVVLFHRRHQAS